VVVVVMGDMKLCAACRNCVYLLTEGKGADVWVVHALIRRVCMSTNLAAGCQTLLCWHIRTAEKWVMRGERPTCAGFQYPASTSDGLMLAWARACV
jgi:hypothetical protein